MHSLAVILGEGTYCSGEFISSIGSLHVREGSVVFHCSWGFWSRWFFKMAFPPSECKTTISQHILLTWFLKINHAIFLGCCLRRENAKDPSIPLRSPSPGLSSSCPGTKAGSRDASTPRWKWCAMLGMCMACPAPSFSPRITEKKPTEVGSIT